MVNDILSDLHVLGGEHPHLGVVHVRPLDLRQSLVISIEGMQLSTVIGIDKDEADDPQPLRLDLEVGLWSVRPCHTDDIADTLNYAALRVRLQRLMREHRARLLESLADMIANIALVEFGGRWVRVKICKPMKFADVDSVGVELLRVSAQTPATELVRR